MNAKSGPIGACGKPQFRANASDENNAKRDPVTAILRILSASVGVRGVAWTKVDPA